MAERDEDEASHDDEGTRGIWSGVLTFGLVSIPVELFGAVQRRRASLRMLGPSGAPLERVYVTDDGEPVEGEDLVRGFEVDGRYLVVSDDELRALEPERSRDIVLERFVPRAAISPGVVRRAYHLAPNGSSTRPYAVLAETMESTEQAGIATFVMRGEEYLVAITAEHGVLSAELLRFADELRSADEAGLAHPPAADGALAEAMQKAIAARTEERVPETALVDERAARLEALVAEKRERGEDVIDAPRAEDDEPAESSSSDETPDLVAVLKRRLQEAGKSSATREGPAPTGADDDLSSETKQQLYERAKRLDIDGRSAMTKRELIRSIRAAEAA